MSKLIMRRTFLRYSGDAKFLQYLIQELQRQYDKSYTVGSAAEVMAEATAEARVELNIPGISIEYETVEPEEDI